ncbi:hypothetical protein FACS1894177_07840 [Bacteroidia bacterium]|nr:hypothetical protein FACS1894177_07840 [Bacteroidia bacterium]
MRENLEIEQNAAGAILNNGVRYILSGQNITIRPLFFGTILTICQRVCEAGLSLQEIESGESDIPAFMVKYGELMMRCVAIAELGKKEDLTEKKINERSDWYKWNLTAFQVYELFTYILKLGGIQAFTTTIRLLWMMKQTNLSPKEKGS